MIQAPIKTFAINLKHRTERRQHITTQFSGKDEFALTIVDAFEHKIGATGLWNTIQHIIRDLVNADIDEYIIICEDDHTFTEYYNKETLYNVLQTAQQLEADLLCGGISWYDNALQITPNLFLIETIFNGAQFTVIFKKFFVTIMQATFTEKDVADTRMSCLSDKVFFLYPFISIQTEFGYSDATSFNNIKGRVDSLFNLSASGIQTIRDITQLYSEKNRRHIAEAGFDGSQIAIPTYLIQQADAITRNPQLLQQFADKPEFDLTEVEAWQHTNSAVKLWQSIRTVIEMALHNEDDVIALCLDNHVFLPGYSRTFFLNAVLQAHALGAGYLTFGTTRFGLCVPVGGPLFWTNQCPHFQLIVLFKPVFNRILLEPFTDDQDPYQVLSNITSNKMIAYPFISRHMDYEIFDTDSRPGADLGSPPFQYNNSRKRLHNIQQKYLQYRPYIADLYTEHLPTTHQPALNP